MRLSVALAFVFVSATLAAPQTNKAKISGSLLKSLEAGQTATVFVSLTQGGTTKDALSVLDTKSFSSRSARLNSVYNVLKARADHYQKDLLAFINENRSFERTDVRQIWATNQIIIRQADFNVISKLLTRPEVASIEEERFFDLEPIDVREVDSSARADEDLAWGVEKILAADVWASGNRGEGIVVSNIDTGVRGGHEALVGNHRAEYGWYDPASKTANPNDVGGHGSHTMGTIAGQTRGIGVAPGATWVACKGCGLSQCSNADLTECGQWVACPTDVNGENPNCDLAPHLVSNSWGGGQNDSFYEDVITVWRTAGIIPLFSNGNAGPTCNTANSPADSPNVIAVGSTNNADGVSLFSSLGPAVSGLVKPDISAPGTDIVSASNLANNRYATMSGTSMSCPHAAGLVALLLSEHGGELSYDEVYRLLTTGAVPHKPTAVQVCGGISNSKYPNNHVGFGRVNAVNTVLNLTMSANHF